MSLFKTLEQKKAKLCLICVERIKLLKEGKWKELLEESIKDFLPEQIDDFKTFRNYQGAKREAFFKFENELRKKENGGKSENAIYIEFKKNFKLDYSKDYASHAKRLPQLIISNGLISALAFYKSKEKDRGQIYQDISEMLEISEFKPYIDWKQRNNKKDLLEFLLDADVQVLRLATAEVISIANWLKRMVEVELKDIEE